MALSEQQINSILEKLPNQYKKPIKEYLEAAGNNENWLRDFPKKMEWILRYSWTDLAKTFAESKNLPYEETRQEKTPPIGNQILELAQRRHTAVNALIPGEGDNPSELKWGSGWKQVEDVDPFTVDSLLEAYKDATSRLLETLVVTPVDKDIVQRNSKTNEITRHITPVGIVKELTWHERHHVSTFVAVFDALTAPFPPSYTLAKTTAKK